MATSTTKALAGEEPPAPPGTEGDASARRRGSLLHRLDVKGAPYAFVAPFFVVFAAFSFYPLIYTSWISLHHVELATLDVREWVGLDNYTELWQDERFWNALTNTITIGVISTVPQLLMALGLAHLLNYRMRASLFFRVASLVPYATSVAAAALVFTMIYERDFGMINWALGSIGIDPLDWEAEKWPSQVAISTIVIWRWTGYNALLYLAAMQAIPAERYEAASIDGASRWKQFTNVTVPGIRSTIVFTIVLSTIGATQLFGEPLIFGQGPNGVTGGADNQYQTLGLLLYEEGWKNYQMGRSATVAWAMFLLLVLAFAVQRLIKRLRARSS
ncbi:carbohydrate ABC transporter permease [Streptomyces nigra]|uniref:Sugar ABC transporter permease n=1 Tax=Streptomyces nigra TaxID=1827580 RepID=A0ABZ1J3L2_9ACTN|nr:MULTISPECIES: sugar ABC transporter permease [Streptomyces]AWE54124.1 sugar ABC transporter permease [Streptomyces nigra]MBQ0997109.1 sugar ABC transporter permease [Streptomyces sp. RK62]MCF2536350.1 sugar ABC transporter permease [Streptomyces sp. FB2]